VVEHLPGMHKALDSISSTVKKRQSMNDSPVKYEAD
jgi:hypothetical protein